jgi:hypothetical protein
MSAMDEGQGQPSSGQSEVKKGEQQTNANFGDFTHFVYSDEGKTESASIAMHKLYSEWILDSGASRHVASGFGEFESYSPSSPFYQGTIQNGY